MTTSRAAQHDQRTHKRVRPLDSFAHLYLSAHRVKRHDNIRTEELAEAFRITYDLPPFPSLSELYDLCDDLSIPIKKLPFGSPDMHGANIWHRGAGPTIFLKPDLTLQRAETTLGHELREVLENQFRWSKPFYVALETHSRAMNQESDQFAGCLLMQAAATHQHLKEIGFDVVRFAAERGRSLPSVLMRARELYPSRVRYEGPVAGVWLFQPSGDDLPRGTLQPEQLMVRYDVRMCGFSTAKNGSASAKLASYTFPKKGDTADMFDFTLAALTKREPVLEEKGHFDLFGDRNFIVVAEPLFIREQPWRVLVTAIRRDSLSLSRSWLERLGVQPIT